MSVDVIMLCKGGWFHKSLKQAIVVLRLVVYVVVF